MTEQANQQTLEDSVEPEGAQTTAVVEYTATAKALAQLEFRMKGVLVDVRTKEGMETAKAWRRELVSLRTDLDKKRLALNESDQARIKARNAEATRIEKRITDLEDPLKADIKAELQRVDDEKAARQRAENDRQEALRAGVADIQGMALRAVGKDSANIRDKIEKVKAVDVDSFEEMRPVAVNAKANTLATLDELLAAVVEQERQAAGHAEMQARMAAQQAENERLQREAGERQQAEAAAERERIEKAERETTELRARETRRAQLRMTISDCVIDAAGGSSEQISACIARLAGITFTGDDDLLALHASTGQKLQAMHSAALTGEQLAAEQRERDRVFALQREADAKAAADRRADAERGIANFRAQVRVASVGNMLREGGTIDCIRTTLEETQAWPVDERFGDLQVTAQQAKDAAVEEIAGMLERAQEEKALRVEREREEQTQREEDARAEAARAEKLRLAEARVAALPDVVQLLQDILSDQTLVKSKAAKTKALAQRVADMLKTIDPLPAGQYYAADGTLMTAEATRSVFDDVDK